ncbi:MAG: c-type cytochrome [Sphingobacteriales bacterium]|jgi:mono/diheme cytochrome c family protein|nr:c-type cytochrome [Sphingobacteriales bacterium]MCC7057468.1 c-type cytochrome [Chitinophagales bacterium]MBK6890680.1 c-type cytochrome [Sphingobacteriales bacterium]MBK7526267.1 c-type cytochrome [Sphingobacteriales bacterium]MBK8677982.1 c-type cytochrome [Sphingobacteriales bacterium]
MKKVFKYLAYVAVIIFVVIAALLSYVKFALPNLGPPPNLTVQITPEKIARGSYLAHHVMLCVECHSTRDWTSFSGPMVPGTEGKGGAVFDQNLGFPGRYIAPNLTPFHLKDWTDGEIFHAVTEGVSKDGRALFPIMPHHLYGQLDKNDIEAVIAYIRSLKPIESKNEISSSDFPMNFIINTIPKKAAFTTIPPKTDKLNYGKYIITASACMGCHTKQEKGKFVGELYAGGFEFKFPDGSVVRSANLTPDKTTGLGDWTVEKFVGRFKTYADSAYINPQVKPKEFQTTMSWTMYAGMDTEDLTAIYNYLQSLSPVNNKVEKFTPAK